MTSDTWRPSVASDSHGGEHDTASDAPGGVTPPNDQAEIPAPAKNPRRVARKRSATSQVAEDGSTDATNPHGRTRRSTVRSRTRESNIAGLGQRARQTGDVRAYLPLPDPIYFNAHTLRQALLNRPLDEALTIVTEGLASALAPAAVQVWLADAAPLAGEQGRTGGQELVPIFRLRAMARADVVGGPPLPETPDFAASNPAGVRPHASLDPFLQDVVNARGPVVLHERDTQPIGDEWQTLLQPTFEQAAAGGEHTVLGTLAGYPLRTRGRFLGILGVATLHHLSARHLNVLEELSDLATLAADRDRQITTTRSRGALAQTVVRNAPVALAALTGPEHTFALTNPTFGHLIGVDSDTKLVGRTLAQVAPDRAEVLAASLRLDAVAAAGEPQMMIELPIRHVERGLTYWNVTTSPLAGLPGGGEGLLVSAVEVTRQVVSRHRSQEAAEVAQERVAQMMTLHATSLAVASQLGADPRDLLADILRRSIALLGGRAGVVYVRDPRLPRLDVIVAQGLRGDYAGSSILIGDGLPGRVAELGQGRFAQVGNGLTTGESIHDEGFGASIAVPLIHRGQVVGVLEVLDDAERRSFTDDDLWLLELFAAQAAQAIENARTYVELERAYRKQRDLDRMKDDFIATASHELRTPLTGVQGFLDLLLDFPGSRDDALAVEFLRNAVDAATELAAISERLLQTSRLDTGRMELHREPVRLDAVVGEALHSIQALQQAQGGHHELIADIPPDAYVLADLGRLKEVVDNLVGNAVKYSPAGGVVTVSCARAQFGQPDSAAIMPEGAGHIEDRPTEVLPLLTDDATDPADDPCVPNPLVLAAAAQRPYLVLTVRDQGMGIAPAEQVKLFGRFARTESARASQIRGTGLGLYICRQILRAMDGDVWLQESAPGVGSVFAVALPLAQPASPELVTPRIEQGGTDVL